MKFKLEDIFNKNEIELISKSNRIEDRVYTIDELRLIRNNIINGIFSRSSKNEDIQKANEEFYDIIEKFDKVCS